MRTVLRRAVDGAAAAVSFLTIVPVRASGAHGGVPTAAGWFPVVGALIGAAGAATYAVTEPALGASVAAVLAIATMAVLTGGLHHDGLADCADAVGARGGGAERRLEVMRDPTVGTFGALALVLWTMLMASSLAQLQAQDAARALITAATVGRWAALVHGWSSAPARANGLGAAFMPSTRTVLTGGMITAGVALAADARSAAYVVATGALVAAAASAAARRTLSGRTGDTLGATVVSAELVAVLVVVATSR